jgi:hypothetical protein
MQSIGMTMGVPGEVYKTPFEDSRKFLALGWRDFKTNIRHTWLLVVAFISYLLVSASALYFLFGFRAQIPSWPRALYSTWTSMSTAGTLTTKSPKGIWVLVTLNSIVGLLFFGFIVWLVTTSLYQSRDAGVAKQYFFQLHGSGPTGGSVMSAADWAALAVGDPVPFNAIQFGDSAWYASGPVVVKATKDLANAGWTVSTSKDKLPIIAGNVSHSLSKDEDFALPVTGIVIGCVMRDEA